MGPARARELKPAVGRLDDREGAGDTLARRPVWAEQVVGLGQRRSGRDRALRRGAQRGPGRGGGERARHAGSLTSPVRPSAARPAAPGGRGSRRCGCPPAGDRRPAASREAAATARGGSRVEERDGLFRLLATHLLARLRPRPAVEPHMPAIGTATPADDQGQHSVGIAAGWRSGDGPVVVYDQRPARPGDRRVSGDDVVAVASRARSAPPIPRWVPSEDPLASKIAPASAPVESYGIRPLPSMR